MNVWIILAICVGAMAAIFGNGALLFVGARYLAKLTTISYKRCVWVAFSTLSVAAVFCLFFAAIITTPVIFTFACLFASVGMLMFLAFMQRALMLPSRKAALAGLPICFFYIFIVTPILLGIHKHHQPRPILLAKSVMSRGNLNGIGKALTLYASENNNIYPSDLDKLITTGLIEAKALHYHGEPTRRFFYVCPKTETPSTMLIACEPQPSYEDKRLVLLMSGAVEQATEPEFQILLAKPENKAFAEAYRKATSQPQPQGDS